jgi:outer membrane lipoprotein carrier protein
VAARVGAALAALWLAAVVAGAETPPAKTPQPSAPTAPAGACADTVVDRVQARYDGLRALRARFEQVSRNVALGGAGEPEAAPSRGRVEFAKPGRMRWEYETPTPSLVVSDGKKLWLYDATAKEVQVLDVEQGFLSAAAIQFLLGAGRLRESFEVKARRCEPQRAELELRPRAEASYERIDLAVDPTSGWIRETTVVDLLGNETRVRFEDIETGAPPDDARFRFEPGPGDRVLIIEPVAP